MSHPPPSVATGPVFDQLASFEPIDWAAWQRVGDALARDLGDAPDAGVRIHHLYLPVLFFSAALARRAARRPLLVGIQAPQGSGKTTLVRHLLARLPDLGLRGVGVSIDDFYLTRAEQVALAAAHPGNPYLEHRGYPGTHDVPLGERILRALQESAGAVRVPVYDKAAHGGRGDRAPESAWRVVEGPLDVVFVEGWMLGFTPVPENQLPDPRLAVPNRALIEYERWHRPLDAFVVLRGTDPAFVLQWRVEAEERMRADGKGGLDRPAIEDYVRRFLPAYALYGGAPMHVPRSHRLQVWLDGRRRPVRP